MIYPVLQLTILSMIVLFAGCPSATVAQQITTDDLRNNRAEVCPGNLTFTCVTRGSFAIAWSSDQYIGPGNTQLLFAAGASVVGEARRSGSIVQTEAILINNYLDNGIRVLISELTITVELHSSPASVTCMHVSDGTSDSVDFEVIADPGVPRDVFAVLIEHVMDSCIVTAFWRSPANTSGNTLYEIKGYNTFGNGTNLSNDTIISGTSDDSEIVSSLLSVPGCFAHEISVNAVNECGRVGPRSRPVTLNPDARHIVPNSTNGTSTVTQCDRDSGSRKNTCSFIMMTMMTVHCMLVMLM